MYNAADQGTKPDIRTPEVIAVDNDSDGVSCDGGGGALGHPRVFFSFENKDELCCSYCNRIFVKK